MTHYRLPFFEALQRRCEIAGLSLTVAYGDATGEEAKKKDSGDLLWGMRLSTTYALNDKICWQPFGALCNSADLIVIAAENKLIFNLYAQLMGRCKIVLWGHGANLQGDPRSLRERFKRRAALRADWWFGYTEHSRPLIAATGFPNSRITTLNNSVDTREMLAQRATVTPDVVKSFRLGLGLREGPVGVYVGSLYAEKRIQFLLDAAVMLRNRIPGFQLLVMGAGPDEALIREAERLHPWIYYLGVRKGLDKVAAIVAADVMLNPGLVGLGILDSFVCEVPMVTTDCGLHSPEIAYLQSNSNGLMTADELGEYVDVVVSVLSNSARCQRLKEGCRESAKEYTVSNMASRFTDGMLACLSAPPRRSVARERHEY